MRRLIMCTLYSGAYTFVATMGLSILIKAQPKSSKKVRHLVLNRLNLKLRAMKMYSKMLQI